MAGAFVAKRHTTTRVLGAIIRHADHFCPGPNSLRQTVMPDPSPQRVPHASLSAFTTFLIVVASAPWQASAPK